MTDPFRRPHPGRPAAPSAPGFAPGKAREPAGGPRGPSASFDPAMVPALARARGAEPHVRPPAVGRNRLELACDDVRGIRFGTRHTLVRSAPVTDPRAGPWRGEGRPAEVVPDRRGAA